jgi:hypothetical protein
MHTRGAKSLASIKIKTDYIVKVLTYGLIIRILYPSKDVNQTFLLDLVK